MSSGDKYLRPIVLKDGKADVYAVLDAFEVRSHALGHAVKKLLCAGQRGHKGYRTDLTEAIYAIERELEKPESISARLEISQSDMQPVFPTGSMMCLGCYADPAPHMRTIACARP